MNPPRTTSPYVTVRRSAIHGRGVFARKDIPLGARIIEYVGEKISKAEADRRADVPLKRHKEDRSRGAVYIFELNKRHDIDGHLAYNTARYINHSCDPNAETEIIRGRIWVIAVRDIARHEEVSYNYGYGYDNEDEHPCACSRRRCVGYIIGEENWPKLKKDLENGTFRGKKGV